LCLKFQIKDNLLRFFLNRMKNERILLSLDGPYSNVMKLKPPLCFNKENAMELVNTLDVVLSDLSLKSRL
jgi:ethanolamine-phosphate phospho-lyase